VPTSSKNQGEFVDEMPVGGKRRLKYNIILYFIFLYYSFFHADIFILLLLSISLSF